MKTTFLDFEQPIAELEAKIEELRFVQDDSAVDISEEIARLEQKNYGLTKDIYAKLTPWQCALVARHPQRPYTLDYVEHIFTDFEELHGDRSFADDKAIVGGLARFNGQPCMVIGHQKGRDTKEKIFRNFGMPRPEGYRKALRLMKMAERFRLPLLTFIAMVAGLAGGVTVGAFDLGIPPQMYIARMHETMQLRHLLVGLSKAPVFALIIALIGCLEGLKVQGTAQSVGERTTSSVVQTISLVIILDAFAALWFMHMGW